MDSRGKFLLFFVVYFDIFDIFCFKKHCIHSNNCHLVNGFLAETWSCKIKIIVKLFYQNFKFLKRSKISF